MSGSNANEQKRLDRLKFVKAPDEPDHTLRDRLYAFARDGELVGDLIERAVEAGMGTRRQIRAAIYLGHQTKGSKFKLTG